MKITLTFSGGNIYTGRLLGFLTAEQFCVLNSNPDLVKKVITGKTASLEDIAQMENCCQGYRVALSYTEGIDSKVVISQPVSYLSAINYSPVFSSKKRELTSIDFVGDDGHFFSLEAPGGVRA